MWAAGLLVAALVLLPSAAAAPANPEPGVIDLRQWQPGQGEIALDGDWLIAWEGGDDFEPFAVPGVWNGRVIAGEQRDGSGHAVLRVRLLLPRTDVPLALEIHNIKSAATVQLDGRTVATRGVPAADAASERPDLSAVRVPLPDSEAVELRMAVSNHFHYEGGIDRSIRVGDARAMERQAQIDWSWALLAIGSMGGLAVYLLALGGWRQISMPGALFVGLILIVALRFAAVSGLLHQLPWMTPGMILRADYLPAFLLPGVYALLVGSLFPRDLWQPVKWGVVTVSALLALTVLLPPAVFTALRDATAVFVIASVLLLLLAVGRAVLNRRPGARVVLAGAVVLGATAVNDALVAMRALESTNLIVPGMLAFLTMHGVAVGGRVFDAIEENRRLSDSLWNLTRSLESQVADRTAALRQESALLDGALESMAPAVLATTSSGSPQAWNTAFVEMFRIDEAALRRRSRPALVEGLQVTFGADTPVDDMIPGPDFTGARTRRVSLPGGEVIEIIGHRRADGGWVCTFIDVTARRLSEIWPEGGGVGTWEWDFTTRRFHGSSRYWSLLGYDPRRMDRLHVESIDDMMAMVHPEDRDTAWQDFDDARRNPEYIAARELRVRRSDGGWLWVLVRACVVRDRSGRPIRLVAAQSDIHDLVQARESLERARDEARRDATEKGRLLAVLSHEIRTPLHGMLGQIDLLRREAAIPPSAEPRLILVQRTGREMVTLLEDIVTMSGVEAGRQPLRQEPFEPRDLVDHLVELVRPRAAALNLTVTGEVDDAVPDELCGDIPKLRQVLMNLLDNAVKFTDSGGITLTMEQGGEGWYRFVVADSGRGMSRDDAARVFDAFYHSADSPGAGLGLYIVGRLTRYLGGRAHATSTPGEGSRFILDLPLEAVVPGSVVADAPPTRPVGARILLVDDEPINRATVREILASEGQHVTAVATAREALDAVAAGEVFDMILLDLRLPGMDGVSAMEQLAAQGRNTSLPVVAFTADDTPEQHRAFLEAGGCGILTKPLDLDAFYRFLTGGGGVVEPVEASASEMDARWAELEERVGAVTLERLLGILRDSLLAMRQELESALADGDHGQCREVAHRLQGSAANYGLHHVEALARAVNGAADAGLHGDGRELIAALDSELTVLNRRLAGS
ncbi:ATP-binding protein [Aquisalimonas asiatica]|uniref:histidine kinase n=1 Tax=Aquisalimonas asiatica TaxID=406100 RepID=A0A1H8SQL3_9GAMM|nr:ATP-binding protein [Aquisalimonas asiatica]SEO80628.1 PAS domain S-box-containing protein [Aquisalimonas asiatica]